jgi:predicted nucleic acid-binding protein
LVAAERAKLKTPEAIRNIRDSLGDIPIVISALSVAELVHGIYRAQTPERSQQRRQFLDELKAHIPIHPVTETTAEIIAQIGGEQAAKGINLPLADLIIGACALELGYAVGTINVRDFARVPGLSIIRL